jgi:hypothetical protein
MTQIATCISTINVLVVRRADPLEVISLRSYPATDEGKEQAENEFVEEVRMAKDGLYEEHELDQLVNQSIVDGYCDVGEGYVAIINSVQSHGRISTLPKGTN